MAVELGQLISQQKAELNDVAAGLAEGKGEKVVAALSALVLGLATGHPEIGLFSPFLQEGARRAFASTATRRLKSAIAASKADEERATFVASIAEPIEGLLGQSLLQIVRVQHRTKDEILDALGGLKKELADFRDEFQDQLDDEQVRVDVQRVREGATGVRISDGARARIWIGEMTVSGEGSVGIDVRRK